LTLEGGQSSRPKKNLQYSQRPHILLRRSSSTQGRELRTKRRKDQGKGEERELLGWLNTGVRMMRDRKNGDGVNSRNGSRVGTARRPIQTGKKEEQGKGRNH